MLTIIENASNAIEALLEGKEKVKADALGLDFRCGTLWVGDDWICTTDRRGLDYYGGFEYIEKDYITSIGRYTIYSAEHQRVADCLEYYNADLD